MTAELLRHLVDSMAEALVVQDEEGRLVYVNRACAELLGYEPEELIGRASRSFLSPDRQAEFEEQFQLRKKGGSEPYEIFVMGRNGERHVLCPFQGQGRPDGPDHR